MRKQTVWVSISEPTPTSGIFVWTIYEVIEGDDDKLYSTKHYTPTIDNSYIYVPRCTQFWTQKQVDHFVNDFMSDDLYTVVTIVGEKKND